MSLKSETKQDAEMPGSEDGKKAAELFKGAERSATSRMASGTKLLEFSQKESLQRIEEALHSSSEAFAAGFEMLPKETYGPEDENITEQQYADKQRAFSDAKQQMWTALRMMEALSDSDKNLPEHSLTFLNRQTRINKGFMRNCESYIKTYQEKRLRRQLRTACDTKEALILKKLIATEPTPENIIQYVACIERNTPIRRHDIPGWMGNSGDVVGMFDDVTASQEVCTFEAAELIVLCNDLRRQKVIPERYTFSIITPGGKGHNAMGMYDNDKLQYIIDPWLSEPGAPAKMYAYRQKDGDTKEAVSDEQWQRDLDQSDKDVKAYAKTEEAFLKKFRHRDAAGKADTSFQAMRRRMPAKELWRHESDFSDYGFIMFFGKSNSPHRSVVDPRVFDTMKAKIAYYCAFENPDLEKKIIQCQTMDELQPYLETYIQVMYPGSTVERP